ncbi:MAG: hypothetical protein SFW35_00205 [Chitinophagales bacterium]|nr:hypothetical protein [Chitinophagales bacterium]
MHHWILAHRRSAIIPIASSALVMAIGFWYLNTRIQLCLALLGILAMAYAVPVLRWRQGLIKLRDIGIFKPFLLASVWTGATALLPMLELNAPLSREWLLLLAQRWFFMAALCIPFDVKDMAYDRATMHSPTLPIRLGLAKTKAIAVVLLAGYLFIAFVRIGCQPALLGYALSFVYVLFLLLRNKTTDPEHYYTFWLDGAMILQLVGVGGYFLKIVW